MASHALLADGGVWVDRPDRRRRHRGARARARRAGGRPPAARPPQPGLRRVRGAARRAAPPRPVRARVGPFETRAGRAAQALAGGRALVAGAARARHGRRARNRPALLRAGRRAARRPPAPAPDAAARSSGGSTRSTSSAATARACTSARPRRCATRSPTRGGGCRASRSSCPGAPPPLTTIASVLSLFPETAAVEGGELSVGGLRASDARRRVRHAARRLLRADDPGAARAYREAAPGRARRSTA